MDYSRYTDEELRRVAESGGAVVGAEIVGPVLAECLKRFLKAPVIEAEHENEFDVEVWCPNCNYDFYTTVDCMDHQ
jgi:hypothetical protein